MRKLLPIFLIIFVCGIFFLKGNRVFADIGTNSLSVATYVPITGSNISTGKLVSATDSGYKLSTRAYDPLVIGVVTDAPAVAIVIPQKDSYPVASAGNTYVLVSASNGKIKKGDLITTSTIPGVGMKATHSGFVIGTALTDFAPNNVNDVIQLPVSISIHYFTSRVTVTNSIFDVLTLSATATYEEPTKVLKYFIAALIIVLSFLFGFWFFGQTANRGIEAIGRNPLAGKIIQMGIILNVAITIAIIAAGVIMAFFVIRL